LTYLFNQGFSSEGQERRYIKAKEQSVAKNAVPACVVPLSFLAKGIGKRGRLSEEETHLDLSFKLSIERKLK